MSAKGIFFIDLDGTLLGADGVHASVWPSLEALKESGWRLSVATGRPGSAEALGIAKKLDEDGLHVFENGAVIKRASGELVLSHCVDEQDLLDLTRFAEQHALSLEVYGEDGRFLVKERDAIVRAHEELLSMKALESPWPPEGGPWVRLQVNMPAKTWEAVEKALYAEFSHLAIHRGASEHMPGIFFVGLIQKGSSKASAMAEIAKRYGVDPERIAMAGDNHNDLQALEYAKYAFVPRTGADAAKKLATSLISGPNVGGVGEAARILLEL